MTIRHKVGTIAGSMAVLLAVFQQWPTRRPMPKHCHSTKRHVPTWNRLSDVSIPLWRQFTQYRIRLQRLTQYVYRHYGRSIPAPPTRSSGIPPREPQPGVGGDLVFFHNNSNPHSYVYHVGIQRQWRMVSAVGTGSGIRWQTIWSSDVTSERSVISRSLPNGPGLGRSRGGRRSRGRRDECATRQGSDRVAGPVSDMTATPGRSRTKSPGRPRHRNLGRPIRFRLIRFGPIRFGPIRFTPIWFNRIWFNPVRIIPVRVHRAASRPWR